MPVTRTGNKTTRLLRLLFKILVSFACFWYISGKIDWQQAWVTISSANWGWLAGAFGFYVLSKVISAFRLNLYFKNASVELTLVQNLKLYWLGMFYNIFLPGSISGDAYKVILLKKKSESSYKKISAAVLLDRLSGLLGIGFILAIYSIQAIENPLYKYLVIAGSMLAIVVLYLIIRRWLKDFKQSFLPTFLLGLLVQAMQVIAVYFILASVGISNHFSEYIFVFLASSIASVLPLTIGGLGIREVVFLEGAKIFGLPTEISVGISLLFYMVSLLSSAIGLIYVFKDPLAKKNPVRKEQDR